MQEAGADEQSTTPRKQYKHPIKLKGRSMLEGVVPSYTTYHIQPKIQGYMLIMTPGYLVR